VFPAFGLIFVFIGSGIIWWARRQKWPLSRTFIGYFMVGFACLWITLVLAAMLPEYLDIHSALKDGTAAVVEGTVTNFHPMPYEGHQDECFSVSSKTFCYSDYGPSAGFNNSSSHGGPIREGLHVRVSYIGANIGRLEIEKDEVPPAEERAAASKNAEKAWQQRTENDPVTDRLNLGFTISAVFMTAWWNLQPKRFMKFWLKPPYKPLTIVLFRVFFAANVLGALSYSIGLVRHRHREWSEYGTVAETAVIAMVVIFLMVNAAEWMNRKWMNPAKTN